MLLTYEDFVEGGKTPDQDEVFRPGPFLKVLEPLVAPIREKERQLEESKTPH